MGLVTKIGHNLSDGGDHDHDANNHQDIGF